ncbi:hypothetical protein SAMN05192529_105135 [Arachidicoccus rhizosphaerae]|uniref:Uncharacterized protein n=1 Tax=Arachidicoccus rhizosphaerae TaxID=551991 RepID=A0A1H3XFD9_9BACT|nr:hypothetical protein [Arachidicoccus rhizosphaerae]SDZ98053.1 hypothetical protein SAMN05192529_105135 [Arachidicoccus rhizosphaerae]
MKANERVVFLFNGDVKTAVKAQECSNVKSHFKLANKLTKLLTESFGSGEIRWTNSYSEIEVDDDFLLEWDS